MKKSFHPKLKSLQLLFKRSQFVYTSLIFLLFIGALFWGLFTYYNRPLVSTTDSPNFTEAQYRFGSLAKNLKKMEQDSIIRSSRFAQFLSRILGYDTRIPKGIYHFNNTLSTLAILDLLINGQEASYLFTLIEGYDIYDIDRELYKLNFISNKGSFVNYSHSPAVLNTLSQTLNLNNQFPLISSEGFLYPDTYRIRISQAESDLTQLAFEQFQNKITSFLKEKSIPEEKWYDAMIMSSLIEKETSKSSEKKLIASVLYNRLNADMKLRYDSTIIYALKKAGLYEANLSEEGNINIKKKHFTFQSPYNTYAIKGLPKTPISSFSFLSMEAVLFPAQSDYLFFIARTRGDFSVGHDFSKTYEEHLEKIKRYYQTRY